MAKLKAKQEITAFSLKQPMYFEFETDPNSASPSKEFTIDDIFVQHKKRTEKQIETVSPGLKRNKNRPFDRLLTPNLTTLVHETNKKLQAELAVLEQSQRVYENPKENRMQELRKICLAHKINSPILGE